MSQDGESLREQISSKQSKGRHVITRIQLYEKDTVLPCKQRCALEHTNLNVIDRMYVFHRIQNNFSNLYLIEKKTNRRLSIYFLV